MMMRKILDGNENINIFFLYIMGLIIPLFHSSLFFLVHHIFYIIFLITLAKILVFLLLFVVALTFDLFELIYFCVFVDPYGNK